MSFNNCIAALDLGTTSIKAMVFSVDGDILGEASHENQLLFSHKDEIEQNPRAWYEDSCAVIRDAVRNAGADPRSVRAIGLSSQGISLVPVDKNLYPIRNAICWLDTRAQNECRIIENVFGADSIFDLTGKFLLPAYTLPKLLWLKANEPDIYNRAYKLLLTMDYTIARFTGNVVTDHSMAAGTMYYDIKKASWSSEILSAFALDQNKLPDICWSGTPAGTLIKEAAELCGLTTDTVVYVGGQDQKVAAYGVDLSVGHATISMGTAGAFEFCLPTPLLHPDRSLPTFPYVHQNNWVMEGCINTAGAAIKWVKDTIFSDIGYNDMNALAESAAPGSGGLYFHPYLTNPGTPHQGRLHDGGFSPLTLSTTRGDIARALYEGLAYESRFNIEVAEKAGADVSLLSIFGGGSKSRIFCDILANVTGKRIRSYSCPEFGCIGAARLAAVGLGMDPDLFIAQHVAQNTDHIPDPALELLYTQYYKGYIRSL